MRRKTILWIVAAVIAAAVIAAVGIVAYHVGFNMAAAARSSSDPDGSASSRRASFWAGPGRLPPCRFCSC